MYNPPLPQKIVKGDNSRWKAAMKFGERENMEISRCWTHRVQITDKIGPTKDVGEPKAKIEDPNTTELRGRIGSGVNTGPSLH